jgi:hypothetical protein
MSTRPDRWWGRPLAESRWALELARLSVDPLLLGRGVAHGDGRPVVLMPGFLAGDPTLLMLATWLRRIGHRPYGCGFVANVDCSDRALERVDRRVEELHHRHGRRVALVGTAAAATSPARWRTGGRTASRTPSRSAPTCSGCSGSACRPRPP